MITDRPKSDIPVRGFRLPNGTVALHSSPRQASRPDQDPPPTPPPESAQSSTRDVVPPTRSTGPALRSTREAVPQSRQEQLEFETWRRTVARVRGRHHRLISYDDFDRVVVTAARSVTRQVLRLRTVRSVSRQPARRRPASTRRALRSRAARGDPDPDPEPPHKLEPLSSPAPRGPR